MVSKPFKYIDQVRDAIDKEQRNIVDIVKNNNEKYLTKISQMDHKISKVLMDTETLLDQYRKKIKDVSDNVEKTRQFKEEINFKVTH